MTTASVKIVFLGPTGVGKTAIATRFARDSFSSFSEPTIGASFLAKTLALPSYSIRFNLWDTAGQERYDALTPMYYRGAHAAVLVFDLTHATSFDDMARWVQRLQCDHGPSLIYLVGNKCDKQKERRVSERQVTAFARRHELPYIEVSALNGQGIQDLFLALAEEIRRLPPPPSPPDTGLRLGAGLPGEDGHLSGCCSG